MPEEAAGSPQQAGGGGNKHHVHRPMHLLTPTQVYCGGGSNGGFGAMVSSDGDLLSWGGEDDGRPSKQNTTVQKKHMTAADTLKAKALVVMVPGSNGGGGGSGGGNGGGGSAGVFVAPSSSRIRSREGKAEELRARTTPRQFFAPEVPLKVGKRVAHFVNVACGASHCIATTDIGVVFTWGKGNAGCLGHGNSTDVTEPHIVSNLRDKDCVAIQVAAGELHSAVLLHSGKLMTCGWGDEGRLGYCGNGAHPTFRQVTFAIADHDVCLVACGGSHTAAVVSRRTYVAGAHLAVKGAVGTGVDAVLVEQPVAEKDEDGDKGDDGDNRDDNGDDGDDGDDGADIAGDLFSELVIPSTVPDASSSSSSSSSSSTNDTKLGVKIGSTPEQNRNRVRSSSGEEEKQTGVMTEEETAIYTWGEGSCGQLGRGDFRSHWKPGRVKYLDGKGTCVLGL